MAAAAPAFHRRDVIPQQRYRSHGGADAVSSRAPSTYL